MTKQKVGLGIFWAGVIWAFIWLVIGWTNQLALRYLIMEEIIQAIWEIIGPLTLMGAIGGPHGALLAGVGILLYSGVKGWTVWMVGIGILIMLSIPVMFLMTTWHFPPLFGIGGTLILLFFTGILWLWAKERMALKDSPTAAADFKLIGYVFMLIAAWFICGIASEPFRKVFEGLQSNPIFAMIFLVLGWLFLFLGHYKLRKQQR
ncbi:hypothetical protein ACFLW8_03515 [Chloroflexota bacterium]